MAAAQRAGAAPKDEERIEQAILALVAEHPDGITQDMLNTDDGPFEGLPLARYPLETRVEGLNRLMQSTRLMVHQQGMTLLWRLPTAADTKAKGLSAEEAMVLQVIRNAGNTGVWTRDLKLRTNLGQPQVTRFLKALEGRGLIKAVKNVNNPSRKLYMLAELEPSREITGGAWYTNSMLDSEFIDVLREAAYKLVARNEATSVGDITATINARGVSRVPLSEDDLTCIMHTLEADGRIEAVDDGERYRPAVLAVPESTPFTAVPCGSCPVMAQCAEGGPISPATCVYFSSWLQF